MSARKKDGPNLARLRGIGQARGWTVSCQPAPHAAIHVRDISGVLLTSVYRTPAMRWDGDTRADHEVLAERVLDVFTRIAAGMLDVQDEAPAVNEETPPVDALALFAGSEGQEAQA